MRNGHFVPATDRKGRSTAATYALPVRWALPTTKVSDAATLPPHVVVSTELYVNAEGMVTMCKVVERTGLPQHVDPCAQIKAGSDVMALEKDGRQINYRVIQRMETQTILGE